MGHFLLLFVTWFPTSFPQLVDREKILPPKYWQSTSLNQSNKEAISANSFHPHFQMSCCNSPPLWKVDWLTHWDCSGRDKYKRYFSFTIWCSMRKHLIKSLCVHISTLQRLWSILLVFTYLFWHIKSNCCCYLFVTHPVDTMWIVYI